MSNRIHISYVTSSIDQLGYRNNIIALESTGEVDVFEIKEVYDLFPLLSDPKFNTDLICIDIESIQSPGGPDIFDVINAISTIIKSTVYRPPTGKPLRRTTQICITSDMRTNVDLIKNVLGTVIKGIYPKGSEFSIEEKLFAIHELSAGNYYIPKLIQTRLRPKKCDTKTNEITLTNREHQILTLIQERGASNKVIARVLTISESTVKLHVGKVLKKYGCKNRTQLALFSKKPNTTEVQHNRRSSDSAKISV